MYTFLPKRTFGVHVGVRVTARRELSFANGEQTIRSSTLQVFLSVPFGIVLELGLERADHPPTCLTACSAMPLVAWSCGRECPSQRPSRTAAANFLISGSPSLLIATYSVSSRASPRRYHARQPVFRQHRRRTKGSASQWLLVQLGALPPEMPTLNLRPATQNLHQLCNGMCDTTCFPAPSGSGSAEMLTVLPWPLPPT